MKDVLVVGGGAGGVTAAVRASQLGGAVALVEEDILGGLCMNGACVPFRHRMLASDALGYASFAQRLGISFNGVLRDYTALRKRDEELLGFMRMGVAATLKRNGIECIKGRGRLAGKGAVEVKGEVLSCGKVILATGSSWVGPDFPGGDLEGIFRGTDLLTTDALPNRALLFGSHPWALEIGQFLHRFGKAVILATREKTVLPEESKAVESRLRKVFQGLGIAVRRESRIRRVSRIKDGLSVSLESRDGPETLSVDRVYLLDRCARLDDLGLESVGLVPRGDHLPVNARMETGAEGVYAIGDLTGPQIRHYSHHASEGGMVAAENAMGLQSAIHPRTSTRVLFTQPQVACVGLTPKEAKEAGYDVLVGAAPLGMNPLGMLLGETEGIVEVVADRAYGEILGAHLLGSHVSEMVGQIVLAIQMEATLEDLARVSSPHPTLSESIAEAARNALGRSIYLP